MHEGHRNRLTGKIKEGGIVYEHELMEVLLFNAVPRKDVNDLSHALINRFGSIEGVFNASVWELARVEGVGENVAEYLFCLSQILDRSGYSASFAYLRNTAEFKNFLALREDTGDALELFMLDKDGRVRRAYILPAEENVPVSSEELIRVISVFKPYGLFVSHRRAGENYFPSRFDDDTVAKISDTCGLCGVRFYDYCVVSEKKDIFSYFVADRAIFSPAYGKVR